MTDDDHPEQREHLPLSSDIAVLQESLCPENLYDGLLADIDTKQTYISEQIKSTKNQICRLFSELMDQDCI